MAQKDLHSNIKVVDAFTPVGAQAADATGPVVDTAGYESVEFVVTVGAEAFTMNASNFLDLIMQHGDLANGSDQAAVTNAADQLGTFETPASGIAKRLDDAADAPGVYRFGYRGLKRYVRLSLDFTGTVTGGIPVAGLVVLAHPRHAPVP